MVPIPLPFRLVIDIGIFIIDLLVFLFVMGTLIKSTDLIGKKKAWRSNVILQWFLISDISFEFINFVAGEDMVGIKNGVVFSFFILVGSVGIYGLILYGKEINKSRIFRSRAYIVGFLIAGFLAFAGFTLLPGLLGGLFPILNVPEIPIFTFAFSICFSIVAILGLLYYYIREKV